MDKTNHIPVIAPFSVISNVSYMLVCSLYAVAVQSKTKKGAFAIIFFIRRDLLDCLWNTCTSYIIIIQHIKQSIIVLITSKSAYVCYMFEKGWCRVALATPEISSEHKNSAKYGSYFQTIFLFLMAMVYANIYSM